jgi:hypothetical protein
MFWLLLLLLQGAVAIVGGPSATAANSLPFSPAHAPCPECCLCQSGQPANYELYWEKKLRKPLEEVCAAGQQRSGSGSHGSSGTAEAVAQGQ